VSAARLAGVVAVGDELLAGAHPDLDSPLIAARLPELGREVVRVTVVGDDEPAIAEAVADMARRVPLVFVTGGLGPTLDDVTRHGVARAAGVEVVHSEEAWSQVSAWYARAGREMPRSNRRQALVAEGAAVLENRCGTAPGFRCRVGPADVFVLPGPPAELEDMFDHEVAPWLVAHPVGDEVIAVHSFHLIDLSESVFADAVGDWMARDTNPRMGCTVKAGVLTVRLLARGADEAEADAILAERAVAFRERFGAHLFSEHTADPAEALGQQLLAKGLTVTTAESCTGGLIAAALTGVPGISAVLREAVVTYADEAKSERLGVPRDLLERYGAVSEEVVGAMAAGAAERTGARLALAVSGVVGPAGGTPDRPVGLVWFGLALDGEVRTESRRWPPAGRDRVRAWATSKGLSLLLEAARRA
jgi:nicotinamide-nucleotide amidase